MTPNGDVVTLRSGHQVLLRPLRRDDKPGLAAMYEQLSDESRYQRFFTVKPRLASASLDYLTGVDHYDHEALVAEVPASEHLVGVARYVRDREWPEAAEIAVTVVDGWQGRGLGTVLLQRLAQRAAESGIRYFTAEILRTNKAMLGLVRRLGTADLTSHGNGTVRAHVELADPQEPEPVPAPRPGLLRAPTGT